MRMCPSGVSEAKFDEECDYVLRIQKRVTSLPFVENLMPLPALEKLTPDRDAPPGAKRTLISPPAPPRPHRCVKKKM